MRAAEYPIGSHYLSFTEWSLDDFARVFERPLHPSNSRYDDCDGQGFRDSWTGDIKSLDAARARLEGGWTEGASRISALSSTITAPGARYRKRRLVWSDSGDELNVDRALRGDDQLWRTSQRVWSSGPTVVDLWTFLGGSHFLTPEQMFWKGAAAVVLTDVLEQNGYQVRLTCMSAVESDAHDVICTSIVLKDEREPMRVDAVASVLCCAGIYRTHGFRAKYCGSRNTGDGGGSPFTMWHGCPKRERNLDDILCSAGEYPESVITVNQTLDSESCIAEVQRVIALISGE